MRTFALRRFTATAFTALLLAVACSHDSTAPALTPGSAAFVAGSDAQTATVGQAVGPVGVMVVSSTGVPMSGVHVGWAVLAGGGSVSADTSITDSTGVAHITWTLGTTSGSDSLRAVVIGVLTSPIIGASATPGPAITLVKLAGDSQALPAGSTAQPLVVKALDAYGNAVPNTTITWVAVNGGELATQSTVTGADGTASDTFTVDLATSYQVMAELATNTQVDVLFTESGT